MADSPSPAAFPAMLRRRLGGLHRHAVDTVGRLADLNKAIFVVGSRHGDYGRTVRLLESLADDDEVSPADFSLSVHNALAGLLSIAMKNRQSHVSIAAGPDTFNAVFMESFGLLYRHPGTPVVVICCDEPLPASYTSMIDLDESDPVVLAVLLQGSKPANGDDAVALNVEVVSGTGASENMETQIGSFIRLMCAEESAETRSRDLALAWSRHV
ncbi:MAG: beta-ketoacyl synthase chain length factor [Haliea sp.]